MSVCKYNRFNPFLNEAYLIKYSSKNPAQIVLGKSAYIKRATEHPKYAGHESGVIVKLGNGNLEYRKGTVVLDGETLIGGWSKIHMHGYKVPLEHSVKLEEYIQYKNDGTKNTFWKNKPATMIRKVALVQNLREAFPEYFTGTYDSSEIDHEEPRNVSGASPEKQQEQKQESLRDYKEDAAELIRAIVQVPERKEQYLEILETMDTRDAVDIFINKITEDEENRQKNEIEDAEVLDIFEEEKE
jgi:phage recombination protein Bet